MWLQTRENPGYQVQISPSPIPELPITVTVLPSHPISMTTYYCYNPFWREFIKVSRKLENVLSWTAMERSLTSYVFIFVRCYKAQNCLDILLLVICISLSDSSGQDDFMLGLEVKFVSNIMFNPRIDVLTFNFILTAENIKRRYNITKINWNKFWFQCREILFKIFAPDTRQPHPSFLVSYFTTNYQSISISNI